MGRGRVGLGAACIDRRPGIFAPSLIKKSVPKVVSDLSVLIAPVSQVLPVAIPSDKQPAIIIIAGRPSTTEFLTLRFFWCLVHYPPELLAASRVATGVLSRCRAALQAKTKFGRYLTLKHVGSCRQARNTAPLTTLDIGYHPQSLV